VILYQDGLLKLDYDVATDILYLPCPDIYEHEIEHMPKIFTAVVDVLNNYNIKKLLFDTSQSQVLVSPREYQHMIRNLTYGLTSTPLQKLARVISPNTARENQLIQLLENLHTQTLLSYELRNFITKDAAYQWLLTGN
jgi:hypothetical protein